MRGHLRERSPGHWAIVIDVREGTVTAQRGKDIQTIAAGKSMTYPLDGAPHASTVYQTSPTAAPAG